MSTKFVKFPPEKQADAAAYCNECTAQYIAMSGEVGGLWYIPRVDKNNNWTVALYGPPWIWDVLIVEEPPSCAALRVDAVVVDTPEWPNEE